LQYLQSVLNLRDEDILPILTIHNYSLNPPPSPSLSPPTQQSRKGRIAGEKLGLDLGASFRQTKPPVEDDLSSEKGIDYTKLRDLLKEQKWKEADQETYNVMIRAVGKKSGNWFTADELLNFPCTDLKTIDALWVKYSKGHFGFSVQKQIYVECGGTLDGKYPGNKIWQKFADRVGWRKDDRWLSYDELNPSFSSPNGISPRLIFFCGVGRVGTWAINLGGGGKVRFSSLASRLVKCSR
jgi:GUN4-like